MLVEVAGREDFRRPEAALIEDAPHLPAERVEIAAVQTHHRRPQPGRHERSRCRQRVVGVQQVDRRFGEAATELDECVALRRKRLHPRMRHRAGRRHAKATRGFDQRRPLAATDERRARRRERRIDAVCAPRAEFDDRAALCRAHDPGGLARHARLKADDREERGLHQLRLGQRRRHAQQRLVREYRRSFRHRPHIAGKAERLQVVVEELARHLRKLRPFAQPRALLVREPEMLEIVEGLVEAGGHQERSPRRQTPDEQLERGRADVVRTPITGGHRQLIQVGRQGAYHSGCWLLVAGCWLLLAGRS